MLLALSAVPPQWTATHKHLTLHVNLISTAILLTACQPTHSSTAINRISIFPLEPLIVVTPLQCFLVMRDYQIQLSGSVTAKGEKKKRIEILPLEHVDIHIYV